MALTAQQRADVRRYTGWSARFRQFDSALENAMDALATEPEHEAQITNALAGDPPGLLAQLKQIDVELVAARGRYRADKVGSIELNRAEPAQLRRDGRELVGRLCTILGVECRSDPYGGAPASNWIGK